MEKAELRRLVERLKGKKDEDCPTFDRPTTSVHDPARLVIDRDQQEEPLTFDGQTLTQIADRNLAQGQGMWESFNRPADGPGAIELDRIRILPEGQQTEEETAPTAWESTLPEDDEVLRRMMAENEEDLPQSPQA